METIEFIKLQELFADLKKAILDIPRKEQEREHRSTQINELAGALAKAQGEMKVADLNKVNPYFKSRYADLQSVVEHSRPALTKYGLSVTQQQITDDNGASWLITTLWHVSGQWIESRCRIVPAKNDIQSIQSHITYLRRSSYSSLIGVVVGENDDDGEGDVATSRETFAKGVALNTKYNPKEVNPDVIVPEQLEELNYELQEYPDLAEQVLDRLKIQSLADMPKAKYQASITRIREIKNARNNGK